MYALDFIDFIFIAITLAYCALGFMRGTLLMIVPLFVWIVALAMSVSFFQSLANAMFISSMSESSAYFVSALLIFILMLIVGYVIKLITKTILGLMPQGLLLRLSGILMGCMQGFVIVISLIFLFNLTSITEKVMWQQSLFVNGLSPIVNDIVSTVND